MNVYMYKTIENACLIVGSNTFADMYQFFKKGKKLSNITNSRGSVIRRTGSKLWFLFYSFSPAKWSSKYLPVPS